MSRAASGLLRALLHRVGEARDRIFLIDAFSTEWQSLTFTGERHEFTLRIAAPDPKRIAAALAEGLADAEFEIAGHVVADLAALPAMIEPDGSIMVRIEALTVSA